MKRILSLLLCAVLVLLPLGGCKGGGGTPILRYDIPSGVENLDPQFAADPTARMILGNLYEGLVTLSPAGEVLPGVAERWAISEDECTYTFTLREGARWSSGDVVTAGDFVFTFQRLFSSGSPFAGLFSAISGAESALASGRGSVAVQSPDPRTVVIQLDYPDPFFLERLTDPAAFPCNKKFFDQARGRYGLEKNLLCTNGPFYLSYWDSTKLLRLRPLEGYLSDQAVLSPGVNLSVEPDAEKRFHDGKTDLALVSYGQRDALQSRDTTMIPLSKTVWCIVFNQDAGVWGNPLLRQGLAHAVNRQQVQDVLPAGLTATSMLVPDAVQVGGQPFRPLAASQSPLAFDTVEGQRLFSLGLAMANRDALPDNATILFPDTGAHSLSVGEVQQGWQKYLSAYLRFEPATPAQIESNFHAGSYQLLLLPISPASSDIASLLGVFASDSPQNYFGYRNVVYDELLHEAASQPTAQLAAQKYAQAETILLSDGVVIPLFQETSYLAVSGSVSGLTASSFGDQIYFKYAVKEK